jgi:mono/diheme cytochrome c family protein
MISCRPKTKYNILFTLLFVFSSFFAFAQGEQAAVAKEGVTAGAAAPAAGGTTEDAAAVSAGEALFKNNCAACHATSEEVVVGPGLKNVHTRRANPWLISWIKNSSKLIQSGDKQAVEVFNKFNKQQMPSFAFSDAEINSIISYLKSESSKVASVAANKTDDNTTGEPGKNVGENALDNVGGYLDILLIVLIVVLIVMVITLLIIANLMKDYLRGKKDLSGRDLELVEQRFDFSKIFKSKAVRIIAGLILLVVILDLTIDKVMGIGIQQGYQPKQPIAFSHKIHAGDNKIDCNYCHTSVYKSKNANIPSANICMNCHSQIKKESPEIQKIYRAIEKNRPIEWIRVHNLPDLAYFNHSQHTKVGGIECQTCHGPIETMDVVYQFSPLTMGWCIDCHRNTPLNTKGNAYYDNLVKIHESESKDAFTVASNGGTECARCHY